MNLPGISRWRTSPADALALFIARLGERRRVRAFERSFRQALAELGLEPRHVEPHARTLMHEVCTRGHAEASANPHSLALELFLRLVIEYPRLVAATQSHRGLLTRAVRTVRAWRLIDRIDAGLAEAAIERIKQAMLASLGRLEVDEQDRVEMLAHIAEL